MPLQPKICAIAETWLGKNYGDEIFTSLVPDYCIYRADRHGRGGGVALLCHNSVMCSSPIAIYLCGWN